MADRRAVIAHWWNSLISSLLNSRRCCYRSGVNYLVLNPFKLTTSRVVAYRISPEVFGCRSAG